MKDNDLTCPECGRFQGDHEEWCSLGRNWMSPGLKRWLFLIVMAIAVGLLLRATATGQTVWWRSTDYAEDEATWHTYNQWHAWREAFETIARSKGLKNGDRCTTYSTESDEVHPQRLRAYYRKGFTPEAAFEDIGCDAAVFDEVWMKRLRQLARQRHIKLNPRSEEAFQEWLWLEYFTENKTPEEAVKDVADSGYMKGKP